MAATTNGHCDSSEELDIDEPVSMIYYLFLSPTFELQDQPQVINTDPINILILGETGVGKSTFINSLVNYLTYTSFEAAEENDQLLSLIPCAFTITDRECNVIKVVTGQSANECFVDGQCATQKSTMYRFQKDEFNLQLIDTPGVGDTRGIEKDQENFDNVIEHIKQLDEIHAIVILLKPNESKLNLMFRFCIRELLSHLHVSALDNIMFGFTNSRCTFYHPGDTLPALEKLLDSTSEHHVPITNDNVYCFDSESYRFLAATKQGVVFPDEIRQANIESWEHSANEAMRLLLHISNLKPHQVKDTTALDKTCKLVQALVKPVIEISRLIDQNMLILNCETDSLRNSPSNTSKKQLLDRFAAQQVRLESRRLLQGRVVCTHANCVTLHDRGLYKIVDYTTICHEGCQEIDDSSSSQADMTKCVIMQQDGRCLSCDHSHTDHIHITYETVAAEESGPSSATGIQESKMGKEPIKKLLVAKRQEMIDELKQEKKELEVISIKLGFYLKRNAIIASNDTWLEYLNDVIKQEEKKAALSKDHGVLNSLFLTRRYYKMQIELMEQMPEDDSQLLNPELIDDLLSKLKDLKTMGPMISNLLVDDTNFM